MCTQMAGDLRDDSWKRQVVEPGGECQGSDGQQPSGLGQARPLQHGCWSVWTNVVAAPATMLNKTSCLHLASFYPSEIKASLLISAVLQAAHFERRCRDAVPPQAKKTKPSLNFDPILRTAHLLYHSSVHPSNVEATLARLAALQPAVFAGLVQQPAASMSQQPLTQDRNVSYYNPPVLVRLPLVFLCAYKQQHVGLTGPVAALQAAVTVLQRRLRRLYTSLR